MCVCLRTCAKLCVCVCALVKVELYCPARRPARAVARLWPIRLRLASRLDWEAVSCGKSIFAHFAILFTSGCLATDGQAVARPQWTRVPRDGPTRSMSTAHSATPRRHTAGPVHSKMPRLRPGGMSIQRNFDEGVGNLVKSRRKSLQHTTPT
ncbi:unnamed protein product [Protopolystoma xenopodis]|uniref:Secreted protein n=1 Tax=Protopolystoma xenopodis TaxID=117903 RepID=A0A3S5CKA9_9PLAT|nr:unnamed protein product [Protopolystoma xenopodis]